jgi:hypothetical protein
MHCPAAGGFTSWSGCTTEIASFCERNCSERVCAGVRASNRVSAPGTFRPVVDAAPPVVAAPFVPASEGLVLETSKTSMLVIANSVQGIATDALTPGAPPTETLVMLA